MKKVTVILPNYNHSRYLPLRIDSILNQTFLDFEIIILDDCSTDSSRLEIEKYRNHPMVTVIIYNEQNSGSTFLQWEKGINSAKGKYIWIAESDDFSDKDFLRQSIEGLENNPGAGLVFCASNITDAENLVSSKNFIYGEKLDKLLSSDFLMDGKEFCEQYLFFGCVLVNASAIVFEKKLYENVNSDYKNYKVSGDWRMWTDICYSTKVLYIKESLNYFRCHTNNVRTNKANIMNGEAILNYLASYYKTTSKSVKKKLKERLFAQWRFEFSRDIKNKQFKNSINFGYLILKIDYLFPFKVIMFSFSKVFHFNKNRLTEPE